MDPGQRRALPNLSGRNQFCPLPNASESNADRGRVLGGSGIERRATSRTELLCPTIPTIRDLDVALRLSANNERFDGGQHDNAEGGSGHHLAVSAMADHYPGGVNLRGERNFAAMTGAIDPQRKPHDSIRFRNSAGAAERPQLVPSASQRPSQLLAAARLFCFSPPRRCSRFHRADFAISCEIDEVSATSL